MSLPILKLIPNILNDLNTTKNGVLIATPGAGKTTCIPPALTTLTKQQILVIQPRRIAAINATKRIASENNWELGKSQIGYKVRLDSKCSANTQLIFITPGILFNILRANPFMENFYAVIFDEFHERTLEMDLCLAMLRTLQLDLNSPLKILIMSATIDPDPLLNYLKPASFWQSEDTLHPLEIIYTQQNPKPNFANLPEMILDAINDASTKITADILVFLPGFAEINRCMEYLKKHTNDKYNFQIMHASLPLDEQQKAFNYNDSKTRIVLATNIAESSVTIPGIRIVIDAGLQKSKIFNHACSLEKLETHRISQHASQQRAGRAARLGPGLCYRLWTQHTQSQLLPQNIPEIKRLDLAQAYLDLLSWGLIEPQNLKWLEQPEDYKINAARDFLTLIDAIENNTLTQIGEKMASLGIHPRLARWLLASLEYNCLEDASLLAVLLSEAPYKGAHHELFFNPDLIQNLKILKKQRSNPQFSWIFKIAEQLIQQLNPKIQPNNQISEENIVKSMLQAFPDRMAAKRNANEKPSPHIDPNAHKKPYHALIPYSSKGIVIKEAYDLREEKFIIALDLELVQNKRFAESIVRKAVRLNAAWIPWKTEIIARYEPEKDRTIVVEALTYKGLTLRETHLKDPKYDDLIHQTFLNALSQNLQSALPWKQKKFTDFSARLNFVQNCTPELQLPILEPDYFRVFLPELAQNARSFAELQNIDLASIALNSLSYEQRTALDQIAPPTYTLPSNRSVPIDYTSNPPVLAARIQHFFGLHHLPSINNGKTPLMLHLCAPNDRVEQVTQDIENFWSSTYPELRKILRARYPKHDWPATAP